MRLPLAIILLALLVVGCPGKSPKEPPSKGGIRTKEILSKPFAVDGLYTSMAGPSEDKPVSLVEDSRELLWIVGYEAELIQEGDEKPVPERFMCHASLDMKAGLYAARMGPRLRSAYRLFTLSQGITKVRFPDGFGLPVPSDQLLWVRTQVLNLESEKLSGQVRFRVKLHYIKDSELEAPMKALFLIRAPVVKAVDPKGVHFGGVKSEAGCSVGVNANPDDYLEYDSKGQAFIPHWKVKQGRETTKTLVTERLGLPADMRVHTIVTHVHPTAESLTLLNLTEMETVYRANIAPRQDGRLGIASVETYSSAEGLLLEHDKDYGLISVYDNKTDRELDSMAVMYLYVHDPEYVLPTAFELTTPLPPKSFVANRSAEVVEIMCRSPYFLAKSYFESSLKSGWTQTSSDAQSAEWTHKLGTLRLKAAAGQRCHITLRIL